MNLPPFDRDDDLLVAATESGLARARVYRFPEVAVVIGRGGDPAVDLRLEAVRRDGVTVRRRTGGGGAVVLDPGNVIASVAVPLPGISGIKTAFERISDWLISALATAGVPRVQKRGISDLALGDRKIGGSSIFRTRGLLFYTGTVLVDPDLELIDRYLRHPVREPDYRNGRPHRAFLGALAPLLPEVQDPGLDKTGALALRLQEKLKTTVLDPPWT